MNPKISYNNLVRQLVPNAKRQPVRLMILRGFVAPLASLYRDFDAWRDEIRMRINLSSQVSILEGYLNYKYDPTGSIRIVTFDDGLFAMGLVEEGENYMPPIGLLEEENDLAEIPLLGENRTMFGDVDFIVYIPAGLDPDMIAAEIEKYRLAGMKYKIIQS